MRTPRSKAASTGRPVPAAIEAGIDELIAHYPEKRSASLMVLHLLQEQAGYISRPALEWAADKLGLQPIHLYELLTFYPMLRQQAAGKIQIKICRTLSCALGGAYALHRALCEKLGLDPEAHTLQTTPDGQVSVEFVECLACCGTAPVLLCNDRYHESVTVDEVSRLVDRHLAALREAGDSAVGSSLIPPTAARPSPKNRKKK